MKRHISEMTDLEEELFDIIYEIMDFKIVADESNIPITSQELENALDKRWVALDKAFYYHHGTESVNEDNYVNPPHVA